MKKTVFFILYFLSHPVHADEQARFIEQALFIEQGKYAIQVFSEKLKGALLSAIKSGGPSDAISVCKEMAPIIADELSAQYDFNIARTSLKTRNPNNRPDAWEKEVLNQFEISKNQGASISSLMISESVTQGDHQELHLMKAIPTGKLCLTCHGENIDPTIQTQLSKLYPDDEAIGFKLGDIRGAFTIRKVIQP